MSILGNLSQRQFDPLANEPSDISGLSIGEHGGSVALHQGKVSAYGTGHPVDVALGRARLLHGFSATAVGSAAGITNHSQRALQTASAITAGRPSLQVEEENTLNG